MSKINFNIDNDNILTADGNLTGILNQIKPASVSKCIQFSVTHFKLIEEFYLKAISNDSKIIGLERTDILDQLDTFLNSIILLWILVNKENSDQQMILLSDGKNNTPINITVSKDLWFAAGLISKEISAPGVSLNLLLKNKLIPAVQRFFSVYKNAAQNDNLNENERLLIKNELNKILYIAIYIRYQISYCIIDG